MTPTAPDDLPGLAARESQPVPKANDRPAVVPQVIADLHDRMELGRRRYGVALQPWNGRSALLDAYEESADLIIYLKQELIERAERDAVYEAMNKSLWECLTVVRLQNGNLHDDINEIQARAQAALTRAAELERTVANDR